MPRICHICHKGPAPGIKYKRRGLVRRKGGAGSKIVGKTLRQFHPNLHRMKVLLQGTVRRIYVCTRCLKAGKVVKA